LEIALPAVYNGTYKGRGSAVATWVKGIDASFSRITRSKFRSFRESGFRVFIQDAWTGSPANSARMPVRKNLEDARREGFVTGAYFNASKTYGADAVDRGLELVGDEARHVGHFLIDVELEGVTEAHIRGAVDRTRALGRRVAIYSASWFWAGRLGDPKWEWLKGVPIWNAYYDQDPDVDFARRPWGPWTAADVIAEQYAGTTRMFDAEVDLDTCRADWWGIDEGCPEHRAEWEARMGRLEAEVRRITGRLALRQGLLGVAQSNPFDPEVEEKARELIRLARRKGIRI
jgi:hypothetical protein